jgi:hypothetical protein
MSVTPNSAQQKRTVREDDTVTCLDDGINPRFCELESTHTFVTAWSPSSQRLVPSTRTANIRTRRSNYGSTLLQSPARAGYAMRMRQMFENAGRSHHELLATNSISYPQLPNISRKASPPPVRSLILGGIPQQATPRGSSSYRQESLCVSQNPPLAMSQTSLPHPSERSSGSWSDDSGYIVTRPRDCSGSSMISPDEWILAWLFEVLDPKDELSARSIEKQVPDRSLGQTSLERGGRDMSDFNGVCWPKAKGKSSTASNPKARQARCSEVLSMHGDPFVSETCDSSSHASYQLNTQGKEVNETSSEDCVLRNVSEDSKPLDINDVNGIHTPLSQYHEHNPEMGRDSQGAHTLEDGGIEISPLSVNVCIERGPSRYHSNRKSRDMSKVTTPCKDRPVIHLRVPQTKENMVPRQKKDRSGG